MSGILATNARPEIATRSGTILSLCRTCWAGIVRYFDRRAAMASLGELDECALRDIGLTRSQIEAAVYGFIVPASSSAAASPRAAERRPAPTGEAVPWN